MSRRRMEEGQRGAAARRRRFMGRSLLPARPRHLSTARARFTLPVTGSIITQGKNPE